MYETHYYTIHKLCPCKIGDESIQQAISIYEASKDVPAFVSEMERQRIIGKRIWYDKRENTIFITKKYACDSGGGCSKNKSLIGVIAIIIITQRKPNQSITANAAQSFIARCLHQYLVTPF